MCFGTSPAMEKSPILDLKIFDATLLATKIYSPWAGYTVTKKPALGRFLLDSLLALTIMLQLYPKYHVGQPCG